MTEDHKTTAVVPLRAARERRARLNPLAALERALRLRHGERWDFNFTIYVADHGGLILGLPESRWGDPSYQAELDETWRSFRAAVHAGEIRVFNRDGNPMAGPEWLLLRSETRFFAGYTFESDDVDRWARPKRGGGRPKGSGSFSAADEPLLVKMHELITSGRAHSPTEAAKDVADKATDRGGTRDSKVTRLVTRYRKQYG